MIKKILSNSLREFKKKKNNTIVRLFRITHIRFTLKTNKNKKIGHSTEYHITDPDLGAPKFTLCIYVGRV